MRENNKNKDATFKENRERIQILTHALIKKENKEWKGGNKNHKLRIDKGMHKKTCLSFLWVMTHLKVFFGLWLTFPFSCNNEEVTYRWQLIEIIGRLLITHN